MHLFWPGSIPRQNPTRGYNSASWRWEPWEATLLGRRWLFNDTYVRAWHLKQAHVEHYLWFWKRNIPLPVNSWASDRLEEKSKIEEKSQFIGTRGGNWRLTWKVKAHIIQMAGFCNSDLWQITRFYVWQWQDSVRKTSDTRGERWWLGLTREANGQVVREWHLTSETGKCQVLSLRHDARVLLSKIRFK